VLPVRVIDVLEHVLREDDVERFIGKWKRLPRIDIHDLIGSLEAMDVRVQPATEDVVTRPELQLSNGVIA
jgi:hypothetical protein